MQNYEQMVGAEVKGGLSSYIARIFGTMFVGLAISAAAAWMTVSVEAVFRLLYGNAFSILILCVAELALVFFLSARITKLSYGAALTGFLVYAFVNGLTLGSIFFVYDLGSIFTAFAITAGTFGIMSVYGLVTKKDLTGFARLAFFVLIGGLISFVINIFLRSSTFDFVISLVMLIVFVGLVAWDTQKLKSFYYQTEGNEVLQKNLGVLGALSLYLDFINIFLYLLRIFGRGRD